MFTQKKEAQMICIIGVLYQECIEDLKRELREQEPADFITTLMRPLRSVMPAFNLSESQSTIGTECLAYYNKLGICPKFCCSTSMFEHMERLVENNYLIFSDNQKTDLHNILLAIRGTEWGQTSEILRSEIKKFNTFAPPTASRENYLLERIRIHKFANCGEYATLYNYFLERKNCFHIKCSIAFSQDTETPEPWHTFNLYIPQTNKPFIHRIFDQNGHIRKDCSTNDIIELIKGVQVESRIVDGWFQKDEKAKDMLEYYLRELTNAFPYEKSCHISLIFDNGQTTVIFPIDQIRPNNHKMILKQQHIFNTI